MLPVMSYPCVMIHVIYIIIITTCFRHVTPHHYGCFCQGSSEGEAIQWQGEAVTQLPGGQYER